MEVLVLTILLLILLKLSMLLLLSSSLIGFESLIFEILSLLLSYIDIEFVAMSDSSEKKICEPSVLSGVLLSKGALI